MPVISFGISAADLVLQAPAESAVTNTQIKAPAIPPSVTNEENLAYSFSISPTSGFLFHTMRHDVEVLVKDRQAVVFSQNNTNLDNHVVADVGTTVFGPVIAPLLLDGNHNSNNTLTLSGLPGVSNARPNNLEFADYSFYADGDHHIVTDTAQIVLGPNLDLGTKSEAEYNDAGNILISAGSTNKLFNDHRDRGWDAYAKGGSIFLLSGEGGYYTGDVRISSHDAQDKSSPLYHKNVNAIYSGNTYLLTGNVPNLEEYSHGEPYVAPDWNTTPSQPPLSGFIMIQTGSGTSTGDVRIRTGRAEVHSDSNDNTNGWKLDRAGSSGSVLIEAGDLNYYYGYTGPTKVSAGSIVVKAGNLNGSINDTDGVTSGEVVIIPGTITNDEDGLHTAMVRVGGTAGLQLPYGSRFTRPGSGVSSGYWNDARNNNLPNPGDFYGYGCVGVIRVCDQTQSAVDNPGVEPLWLEMWNGGDWQRFYSEDTLTHRHEQNTSANIWTINHYKSAFGFPTVQVYVRYNAGQGPAGASGPGWKTLDPSLYEVFLPSDNPERIVIRFTGSASYAGAVTIRFTPNDPFTTGFIGGGNGEDGRGATSA